MSRRQSWLAHLYDLLVPRCCPVCGQRLHLTEHGLCVACNLSVPRVDCRPSLDDNGVVRLFWGRIPVERGAAFMRFERGSQHARLIYSMKYGHQPGHGELLGELMARDWEPSGLFHDIDLLVPVPLSHKRERQRGYNQSVMMARGISHVTGIPVERRALSRQHFQESQTQKNWWERRDNVENAFRLVQPKRVAGRHVLLIDDVVTTGATLTACARELLKAGNVRISILVAATAQEYVPDTQPAISGQSQPESRPT